MLAVLKIVYREASKDSRRMTVILRLFAAVRFVMFPKHMHQYNFIGIAEKLNNSTTNQDPLYFLVHTNYLSNRLTLRQRVESAIAHHKYEMEEYTEEYATLVHKSAGLTLWQSHVDNNNFQIKLISTTDYRNEGELSVVLCVGDIAIWRMSFCYIDAAVFGLPSRMTLLITRNQSEPGPGRDIFKRGFKQNAPQFFCLAAICGVAMANGFETVLGIKHDCQAAYAKAYEAGFRNAYTGLWEQFDAVEFDHHVYTLNVPLRVRALDSIDRSHRARARDRRKHWDAIMQSARVGLMNYRSDSERLVKDEAGAA